MYLRAIARNIATTQITTGARTARNRVFRNILMLYRFAKKTVALENLPADFPDIFKPYCRQRMTSKSNK